MNLKSIRHTLYTMKLSTRILVALLLSLLLASTFLFIRDILDIKKKGPMHPRNPLGMVFSGSRLPPGVPTIQSVEMIDTWMTFRYISVTFRLPETYLAEALDIQSPRYPNLSIRGYIREKGLVRDIFLEEVRAAVRTFLTTPPHQ